MDTPAVPLPQDAREQVILDRLTVIRDSLLLLKRDRTTYIRSQDVIPLYDDTIQQVKDLNTARAESGNKEENRVDKVLESCFQLLSLFYLTIGRNNEAPAAYALTSTIKRLLDHLTEVELYSAKDLDSINTTLSRLSTSIRKAEESGASDPQHSHYLLELFSTSEMEKLRAQLLQVGEMRTNGNFCSPDGTAASGADEVLDLYERCVKWSDMVLERKGQVAEQWKPIYSTLTGIRNELEKLSLTQAWSLRETDLYDFQRQLDKLDESRQGGNFYDDKGRPADLWTQRTLLYLIRRSYAYIYQLMISSEPVSEALLPVYNQLQTLKRCLRQVKDTGGVSSVRELYPYSMKLNSLDNMRQDGKFVVNNDIPEGQGSVSELLAECFELTYELRVTAEENSEKEAQTTKAEA
ncbi:uncharacterized protein J7T54_004640 [Emericellopsis cladophorae]|uniref:Uncharacterized protein n=1 Tax=Emericellopsis cladophorae TaxID=2686198 RepID=A0A9P9Y705_9HYPO|nr:uncharacterized protein J7T54_004640 [Emericellopsis cladophorae]KAI6784094.1 hypothetical protein J7T54_004640 [Emericellopsis cladophorae]